MISTDRLRIYPFFGFLNPSELDAVAMIAEEAAYPKGQVIFKNGELAKSLFLLEKGSIELFYETPNGHMPQDFRQQFLVGKINPGEVFGISALIEPYEMSASAIATSPCLVVETNAEKLRALPEQYPGLACVLYQQALHTLQDRLHFARVQFAVARNFLAP